jgi:hypothetical protein
MKHEIIPNSEAIGKMVSTLVLPTLEKISKDVGRRVEVDVVVMQKASEAVKYDRLSIGDDQMPLLCGGLRLRFREASDNRLLMHCEALFNREQAVHNCSGFSMKGELKENAVKRTAWTMRYSVWDWTGWN